MKEKRKKAADARWKQKQSKQDASAMHVHKDAMQNDADKIREDKIREDKRKEDKSISTSRGLHLFKNSPYFIKEDFIDSFKGSEYELADLDFYYESVKNWSESKGALKKDWKAVARNFMLIDRKDNKLVTKKQNRYDGLNQSTIDTLEW